LLRCARNGCCSLIRHASAENLTLRTGSKAAARPFSATQLLRWVWPFLPDCVEKLWIRLRATISGFFSDYHVNDFNNS
jgi:hypothetical protein